jgi:hypothetical protein
MPTRIAPLPSTLSLVFFLFTPTILDLPILRNSQNLIQVYSLRPRNMLSSSGPIHRLDEIGYWIGHHQRRHIGVGTWDGRHLRSVDDAQAHNVMHPAASIGGE